MFGKWSIAHWHLTRQPSPGAMAYAFEYGLYLPPASSKGNIYSRNILAIAQAPQVYASPAVTLEGYGGLTFPGVLTQNLIDPNASQ